MAHKRGFFVKCITDSERFGIDILFGDPALSTFEHEVPFSSQEDAARLAAHHDQHAACHGTHPVIGATRRDVVTV